MIFQTTALHKHCISLVYSFPKNPPHGSSCACCRENTDLCLSTAVDFYWSEELLHFCSALGLIHDQFLCNNSHRDCQNKLLHHSEVFRMDGFVRSFISPHTLSKCEDRLVREGLFTAAIKGVITGTNLFH